MDQSSRTRGSRDPSRTDRRAPGRRPLTHSARLWAVLAAALAVIAACVVAAVVIYRGGSSDAPTSSPASPAVTVQRTTTAAAVHAPTTTPALPRTRWSWPVEKVMHAIDGTRLRVAGRRVQIDSATALCSGRGSPVVRSGVRRWRAFDCTYTTFKGGIDRDVEFLVAVVGPNRYSVLSSDWVGTDR